MRARGGLLVVVTLGVVISLGFPIARPSARPRSGGIVYANVDIAAIGYARLEALKSLEGVEWWVELDDEMLVAGAPRMLEGLASYSFRRIESDFDRHDLRVLYGRGAEEAGVRTLAKGGRTAVVVADASERERLAHVFDHDGCGRVPHSDNVIRDLVPNTILAHQVANDAPRAAKTNFNASIQALVDSVDPVRWKNDVQTLGTYNRYTRGSGNLAARDWLVQQFQTLPGLVVTTPSFNVPGGGGTTSYNVVATLTGTTRPNDWYIVGGHFDSISNNDNNATAPGCEDNGSGTAAVLEIARIMTAHPPDATVLFICYSGEEQGLYGSTDHASDLVAAGDNSKIKAAQIMDMIGYSGDADIDCLLETSSLGQFMIDAYSAAASQYTSLRIVTSLNPFGSDHVPYLNRGMPALLTIENDWDTYPNYHRSTDFIENVSTTMGGEILKMNVAALAQMIGTPPAGNGTDTIGIYNPSTSTFFLKNTNAPGAADVLVSFGVSGLGYVPLVGDWNGDGFDTIGLYDAASSVFFLKNANAPGAADITFNFGAGGAGYVPIVGDWDGNGTDTIGLYQPATGVFFLRNSNTTGTADLAFGYGPAGAIPVAGDWDGNGADSIGVYVPGSSTFFLRNSATPGLADLVVSYGSAGSGFAPIVGDWNGDNEDSVGLYQGSTGAFFLRNSNSPGNASVAFGYGSPGMIGLRGDWNNQ